MQQKKNTILTTSTANGRAAHTIPTLMKRITVLLALIVSFALGARAASYTISYGNNYLGINNGAIANINPFNATNCVWTGPDSGSGRFSMTVNGTTYYLRRENNASLTVTENQNNATSWTINGERLYYSGGNNYYINYNYGWSTSRYSSNGTLAKVTYKDPTGITAEGVEILVGEEGQITYELTSTSGTPVYDNVTFSINNIDKDIAAINATTGVVTGVSAGTATVTVTAKKQDGTTACTATCSVVVKEPTPIQYVFYYSSNYGDAYYLAVNEDRDGVTRTNTFDAETCIWTGVDVGAGLYSATVDGTTYYLRLQSSELTITTDKDQATQWTIYGAKLYSNERYVRYNNDWTTTGTSTRTGTDVLYPITKINEGTPTTTVEYTIGATTVSPTAAAVDYGKSQQFTANASVTKTTTTTKTDTYQHSSSTGNTIQPKPSVSSTSSETLSPTGYDWSLSSTDNLSLGSGTASTNSVTYSTASGTTKNVTLSVTAYYMDGTSKKQGTAGTATITVNEKKDDPTGIATEDLTLAVDEQKSISYTLTPSNAYDNIAYSGFDNAIISITDGVVKGLKAGITEVTLTAKKLDNSDGPSTKVQVTVTPKAPTIEFSLGANITATISTTETGATIYYTTDGTTPTTSSPVYTAPVSVTAGATVKAIVVVTANGTPLTSPVAEALANAESGIVGNTVYLYDLEDHNWTYYSGVNTSVDGGNYNDNYAGKLYSPNPRNVKITYNANGGAVSIDESETSFVYFKTLEQGATAGQYPYTVISNPFSKRPTGKGFGGWKIISGGEYINGYNNGSTLPLDQEITFVNLPYPSTNCISAEIVLEATWVNAQVTYLATNNDYTFNVTNGSSTTYENNFLVINRSYSGTLTLSQPVTIMMVEPNGIGTDPDYRDNYTFTGNITPNNTGVTKIEYAKWESSKTITADYHNLWIGRGVAASGTNNCASLINGGSTTSTESPRFHVKVESGKYNYMSLLSGYYTNSGGNGGNGFSITGTKTNAKITLGNDYDRAKGDNTALQFVYGISMGRSGSFSNSGNRDNTQVLDFTIKSGRIGYTFFMENTESTNYLQGGAGYCIYLSSGGSQTNVGTRNVLIEGGDICTIGSGIDSYNNAPSNSTTASTTTNYNRLGFNVRIKGGTIHGNVYGGAAKSPAGGNRVMIMTGGQVKGWFAAGCNGTDDAGGQTYGTSYVYIGGTAKVDSEGSTKTLGYANGGNVYAAGAGRQNSTTCGEMTFGTNLVIADKSYIERGAYGGGNYGYAATSSSTKIYVTGGINEGNNGTVNSVTTKGGVYGGANQQNGPNVGIYMTGGEMRGGLYGGSNTTGTISGNVTMQINGGQVGTSSKPANIHGGGYGQSTIVTGNVNLTLGTSSQTSEGVTVWGDIYGGSALGKVNCTVNNNNYQYTNNTETNVTLYKGTINGSLYGGALGGSNVGTHVYGPVKVKVYGGSVKKTSADGSGGVYGANNKDGAPQRSVTVDIYGTDPAPAEGEYALYAVYGGGNQADYLYGNGYPTVTVHGCDNSIEYVYGGGNAAAVAATDVTIWGGNVIGNVFGGGNGESGTAADVNGNVDLKIYGGTIRNVFGGSNRLGEIKGNVNVNVNSKGEGENAPCPMIIGNVYGGGNEADGDAGSLTIGCTGALVEGDEGHLAHPENIGKTLEGIGAVYGGANNADIGKSEARSNITLNINSGMVANVFGGNNTGGNIYGDITVNVNKNAETCGWYVGNVYGAGNLAAYTGSPVVNIQNGTVSGNVFGGGLGETAIVTGNPQVTIGDLVAGHEAYVASVGGDVYGGGDAANVVGTPVVNIVNKCNTTIGNVYGGGNAADVNGTDVNIDGGTITGMVFGGGHGDNSAEPQISANVNGNVNLDITGGTINKVFGGSNSMGNITGSIALNIQKVDGHCDMRIAEVYGGGNEADGNAGSLTIGCTGALVEGDNGHVAHPENIGKTLEGIGAVYGGANNANIGNDVTLNINSGMVARVFGGNNTGGSVNGNVTVNVDKDENTCGWYVGKVHGGGYGSQTSVAENVTVNIKNGIIYGDVYGGSALGKVNTDINNTTTVNLTGGIIKGDAYGGGLGDSTTEADVNGNVTVTLDGTAFELTTTTDDKGNKIPTSGRIFGCNNINGSPKGTVLVKVLNTVARDDEGNVKAKPTPNSGVYELQAVYGGGNLAAYNPTNPKADGQFASYKYGDNDTPHDNKEKPVQVVIDGCGVTSIEYVYGGGNAAATPATDVTILGSREIGSVFGGGNGKDRYTLDGGNIWNENKGADVGVIDAKAYATDKSQGKYGTGNAMTSVLGGTVHNIYGGSNMKGNIVGNAVAYLDAASDCELNAGDIYGGGNEAYMDGGSGIQLGCIKYLKEIYGGARNANVGGDINLTITSGHFDRIFGGNNLGGAINGSITVNIEETGCNPITIGELYGCGNKAAYTTPEGKPHPTLNIRSFTSIGNVYGGGLGEEAVVTGNPTVNINVVKGANNAVENWPYNDGRTIDFGDDYKVTLPVHEKGKIGAIGTVFGGGNAAQVTGNTNVNIGTETSVVFLTGDERTKTVEGADIRGNVYGGGNQAAVTGKTNVKVGRN